MTIKDKINQKIKDFDPLYKHYYHWLAGQYDPDSGGFYYAKSAINDSHFKPDIESTAQALNILERSDLIDTMPDDMKAQIIDFFRSRQTKTGYFYDPHNAMKSVDRMVARAISYSRNALARLGSSPLYPLPGRDGMNTLPDHMQSIDKLQKWLDDRPWDYAWMACDNISAAGIYIECLPKEKKQQYLDHILHYLYENQNPETGMWGEGRPYIRLSGAFKLALFYRRFNIVMPRVQKIYNFILETLREDTSEDMCWTRNAMDLLMVIRPNLPVVSDEDILEILTITYTNLTKYMKPDGGFSRHVESSLKIPNNVPLGKGLVEGDMNAGTQALRIRSLCYELAGLIEKPMMQLTDGFYEKITPSQLQTRIQRH